MNMKEYNSKNPIPISNEPLLQKIRDYEPFRQFDVSINIRNGKASFKDVVGIVNQDGEEIRLYPDYRFKNGSLIVNRLFSTVFGINEDNLLKEDRSKYLWKRIQQMSHGELPNQMDRSLNTKSLISDTHEVEEKNVGNPFLLALNLITKLCTEAESLEDLSSERIESIISRFPKLKEFKKFDEYEDNLTNDQKLQVFMGMAYIYNLGFEKKNPGIRGPMICPLSKIFEYFVLNRMREVFEPCCQIEYQKKIRYIPENPDGKPIGMRPDFIIRCSTKHTTVLDAKYKTFRKDRCYDDLHQVTSYITALRRYEQRCNHGVLIYPKTDDPDLKNVLENDEWFFFIDFDDSNGDLDKLKEKLRDEGCS